MYYKNITIVLGENGSFRTVYISKQSTIKTVTVKIPFYWKIINVHV